MPVEHPRLGCELGVAPIDPERCCHGGDVSSWSHRQIVDADAPVTASSITGR